MSDNNRLSGRYVFEDSEENTGVPLIADFGSTAPNRTQNAVLSDTHTFSPTLFANMRLSYNRNVIQQLTPRNTTDNDCDSRKEFSMIIPSSAGPGARENGIPLFTTTGFASVGDRSGGAPLVQPDENYQITGGITMLRGNHNLKMGGEFRRTRSARFTSSNNQGALVFQPGNPAGSGNALADLFLGLPRRTSINNKPVVFDLLETFTHYYFADDWKVTPKLTLNLGLRYEVNYPLHEPNGRVPFINVNPPGTVEVQEKDAPLYDSDFNNFGPRIGIAYRIFDRTVIRSSYGIFYSENSWLHFTPMAQNPPEFNAQTFFASAALPLVAHDPFPVGNVRAGGLPAPHAYQRDKRTGYVQTWSMNVQHSLANDLVVEVGYVGNHAVKLNRTMRLNIPLPGPGPIQPRRPLQNFGPVNRYVQSDSNSNYNGLQTRIERRFSGGFSLLGTYSFMRNTDLASNELNGGVVDPSDFNRDRSLADTHTKHRLSVAYIYELPFGPGKRFLNSGGFLGQALGGWQLSGVTVYNSGQPLTVTASGDAANVGLGTRPNRICDGNLSSGRTQDGWFDASCFVRPEQFTFGNSGRNIILGPSFKGWDIGIMKRFQITERAFLQFRVEMFNAFNNVNLANPRTRIGIASTARILSAGDPRSIQLGLKLGF